ELLSHVTTALLILLSVITIIDFVRRRGSVRRDIALMFGALAFPYYVLTAVQLNVPFSVEALTLLGFASYFALLAQPFLMLCLLRYFRPLQKWVLPAGFEAMLLAWAGIYALSRGPSPLMT